MNMWDPAPQASQYPEPEHGLDVLFRRLERLEALQREQTGANILGPAGIAVAKTGMTIDSELHVTGDTIIDGTLSLPAGIIDNDALANPIVQRSSYGSGVAFGLTTSPVTYASHPITIPDGCTDGAYSATGSAGVANTTGSTQYVYLRVYAAAPGGYLAWGSRQQVAILSGYYATLSATLIREYDVALTPGASVTFYVEVYASAAMAADASNYAFCEELVTFTR